MARRTATLSLHAHGRQAPARRRSAVTFRPNPALGEERQQIRSVLRGSSIQTKLQVGAPDDPAEREADEVAERVMRMPASDRQPAEELEEPTIQRKCSNCEAEDPLRRKADSDIDAAPDHVAGRIRARRGTGAPLDPTARAFFEPRFGHDFGAVRVHTDSEAATMSRQLGARAFTYGSNIYYGAGHRPRADSLTAHELVHVVQQSAPAGPKIRRQVEFRPPGRGEANAFPRRQELVDQLNRQSTAQQYTLVGRQLRYRIVNAAGLTDFDRQMQGFIDAAVVLPMRLITRAGRVGGGHRLLIDSLELAYVDIDDMLACSDTSFQLNFVHILRERQSVRNYARRIGMPMGGEFNRAHRNGITAETQLLRNTVGDPTLRFVYEESQPNGTDVFGFRGRHGYRIFHVFRRGGARGGAEVRGGLLFALLRDGTRMTLPQLRTWLVAHP